MSLGTVESIKRSSGLSSILSLNRGSVKITTSGSFIRKSRPTIGPWIKVHVQSPQWIRKKLARNAILRYQQIWPRVWCYIRKKWPTWGRWVFISTSKHTKYGLADPHGLLHSIKVRMHRGNDNKRQINPHFQPVMQPNFTLRSGMPLNKEGINCGENIVLKYL